MIKIGGETRDKIGVGMIVNMDFAQDDLEGLIGRDTCNAV